MTVILVDDDLRRTLAEELGAAVVSSSVVHGGDVAAAFAVDLDDGRRVFAKTHPAPPAGFFTTEAAGLSWLRDADAPAVPAVLAVGDGPPAHLVLEWIDVGGSRSGTTEADLGRSLAALHRAGAPCFGREDRRTTGSRGLPNEPCPTWAEFYATQRLLPLARLARDGAALAEDACAALERVAGRLEDLGGEPEPPARLHGDLWAGNRVVDRAGRNWLVDPAAHGGHREFDLAMMRLFGGFGPDCFAAYQEVFPLAAGWQDRVALHQLAPLVVHAIKFGGGYRGAVLDALRGLG
ncbi:MAG: fructosamine kinase family protein [Microthrixaceae bacterium]